MTPQERFWSKVDKSGECWTWTASVFKDRNGYGKFQAGTSRETARVVYAHRFSWETEHVNPAHLFLGTPADNSRDMADKHRSPWGQTDFCQRGHRFTPENTGRQATGRRFCRTCLRASQKRRRDRDRVSNRPR